MAQEIEAKFAVPHLANLRAQILRLGGRLLQDRHLERNWRFDTVDGELSAQEMVLRLREQDRTILTYKQRGPDPLIRREIEFEVSDREAAHQFLQALGYEVVTRYEKYREVFALNEAKVMLDELPFSSFVEVEGPTVEALQGVADALRLDWSARIAESYLKIFERGRERGAYDAEQAIFAQFMGHPPVAPEALDLPPALVPRSGSQESDHE